MSLGKFWLSSSKLIWELLEIQDWKKFATYDEGKKISHELTDEDI